MAFISFNIQQITNVSFLCEFFEKRVASIVNIKCVTYIARMPVFFVAFKSFELEKPQVAVFVLKNCMFVS